ncbi:MAG: hypothetical protein AAGA73_02150 [Pseudomonadota bacterium]
MTLAANLAPDIALSTEVMLQNGCWVGLGVRMFAAALMVGFVLHLI